MNALEWRKQMREAPRLLHENGLVLAVLGERSVVFPSEADTRFFVAAYTEVPKLVGEVAVLRQQIDEKALSAALARVRELETQLAALQQKQATLEAQIQNVVVDAAKAKRRAKILALAIQNKVAP